MNGKIHIFSEEEELKKILDLTTCNILLHMKYYLAMWHIANIN